MIHYFYAMARAIPYALDAATLIGARDRGELVEAGAVGGLEAQLAARRMRAATASSSGT